MKKIVSGVNLKIQNTAPVDKIRIGLTGTIRYDAPLKIDRILWKLKETYGTDLMICSRGLEKGADPYIKKKSLEFGIDYEEYNPNYTNYNCYSAFNQNWYGKRKTVQARFTRCSILVKRVEAFVLFIKEGEELDPEMNLILKEINKLNRKYKIEN